MACTLWPTPTPPAGDIPLSPLIPPLVLTQAAPSETARPDKLNIIILTDEATPEPGECSVIAEALNVRAGPSMSYPAIAWLQAGQAVIPTGEVYGRWFEVSTSWQETGWVYSAFLICKAIP